MRSFLFITALIASVTSQQCTEKLPVDSTTMFIQKCCAGDTGTRQIGDFAPGQTSGFLQIFTGYVIPCSGSLFGWKFLSTLRELSNPVYFAVFQPLDGGRFKLKGRHTPKAAKGDTLVSTRGTLVSTSAWNSAVVATEQDAFLVAVGDVLALFYNKTDLTHDFYAIPNTEIKEPLVDSIVIDMSKAAVDAGNLEQLAGGTSNVRKRAAPIIGFVGDPTNCPTIKWPANSVLVAPGQYEMTCSHGFTLSDSNYNATVRCDSKIRQWENVENKDAGVPYCVSIKQRCFGPLIVGRCQPVGMRYFYNSSTGRCERFYYRNCEWPTKESVFSNNFRLYEDCVNICMRS